MTWTWPWLGVLWLSIGVVLAELTYTHAKNKGNGTLYANVALLWPVLILYIANYRVFRGRWPTP